MEWLQNFFLHYSYFAVFFVLLLCGMGLPLPEDITLVTAGIITGLGVGNFGAMLVVCYMGVMVGDSLMYGLGYHYGEQIQRHRYFQKIMSPKRLVKVNALFAKHGNRLIFIARFLPGLRAPIYVMTGISRRVSFKVFTLMDGLAALLSVPVFVYLGFYGAENHEWLMSKVHEFKYFTFGIIVLTAIAVGWYLWKRRQRFEFLRKMRQKRALKQKTKAL
ncbi:MAG: DedA family protein [Cardiobacteriaceae bacterium]|nr:DedA family protein [Cardiobacteriaceae bacterium]